MPIVTKNNKQVPKVADLPFAKGGPDFATVVGASIRQDTTLGNFFF